MEKNLNDGDIHSFEEIQQLGLEISAKQFAEGNLVLEEILLDLWNLGISTRACCKGTSEEDHKHDFEAPFKHPYISLNVTSKNKEKVLTLIKYLSSEKSKNKPDLTFDRIDMIAKNGKTGEYSIENFSVLTVYRTCITNKASCEMFEFLLAAIKNMQEKTEIKENPKLTPALELIDDLIDREITKSSVQKITIDISRKGKTNFSYGRAVAKNKAKTISKKSITEIKDSYQAFTKKIVSATTLKNRNLRHSEDEEIKQEPQDNIAENITNLETVANAQPKHTTKHMKTPEKLISPDEQLTQTDV